MPCLKNKKDHHRGPQVFCGVLARVPIAATNWSVLDLPDASFDALPKLRIVPRVPNQKLQEQLFCTLMMSYHVYIIALLPVFRTMLA